LVELIEKYLKFEKKLEGSFQCDEIVDIKCWNIYISFSHILGILFIFKKKNYKFENIKLMCENGL
jgi:hypothetical protein